MASTKWRATKVLEWGFGYGICYSSSLSSRMRLSRCQRGASLPASLRASPCLSGTVLGVQLVDFGEFVTKADHKSVT